jgi:hypothetical protein
LAIDHPEIMALVVLQQPRAVIFKRGRHVLLENLFCLKEVPVGIDNHVACPLC